VFLQELENHHDGSMATHQMEFYLQALHCKKSRKLHDLESEQQTENRKKVKDHASDYMVHSSQ
jgi:hypothetical protein